MDDSSAQQNAGAIGDKADKMLANQGQIIQDDGDENLNDIDENAQMYNNKNTQLPPLNNPPMMYADKNALQGNGLINMPQSSILKQNPGMAPGPGIGQPMSNMASKSMGEGRKKEQVKYSDYIK